MEYEKNTCVAASSHTCLLSNQNPCKTQIRTISNAVSYYEISKSPRA